MLSHVSLATGRWWLLTGRHHHVAPRLTTREPRPLPTFLFFSFFFFPLFPSGGRIPAGGQKATAADDGTAWHGFHALPRAAGVCLVIPKPLGTHVKWMHPSRQDTLTVTLIIQPRMDVGWDGMPWLVSVHSAIRLPISMLRFLILFSSWLLLLFFFGFYAHLGTRVYGQRH